MDTALHGQPGLSVSLIALADQTTEKSDGARDGRAPRDLASFTRGMSRGDEDDFQLFHSLYADRLLRYLIVVERGDEQAARDALQETMIRVARHARPFDDERAFWAWLTKIARSAAIDAGRRESRFRSFLHRLHEHVARPAHAPRRAEERGEETLLEHLLRCLPRLDPADRQMLEAKYLQRASVRQLAETLATSEKAVESRLTRARVRLRTLILQSIRHENHT